MVIVVMGVAGAGKTTIGKLLAERLGAGFAEGDSYHSAANVEKMQRGEPLDDADRAPWLDAMADDIATWTQQGRDMVLACSALTRRYRSVLRGGQPDVRFVYLKGDEAAIGSRLKDRRDHYMPASLLASQLATLEEPETDEPAITVAAEDEPQAIVSRIIDLMARD